MKVYRVTVIDGEARYFGNQVEAEFFVRETVEAGLATMLHEVSIPTTADAMASFL